MKKFIYTILLMLLPLAGFADNGKDSVRKNKLMTLISEYNGTNGFEIIKIGSFGTSLLKTALKISASKEDKEEMQEIMKMMRGIKRMAVVDYESATEKTRNAFNSKLGKILDSSSMLMETKEDNDIVRIYGVVDDEGTSVQDFLIHIPADGALICLFGSIPIDTVSKLAGQE